MAIMPVLGHFSQLYGLAGSSLIVSSGLTHGAASEGEVPLHVQVGWKSETSRAALHPAPSRRP